MQQTFKAHHTAFIETDGADPEWAAWYAGFLSDRLPDALGVSLDKAALAAVLVELDEKQTREAPDRSWHEFYADELLRRYAAGS